MDDRTIVALRLRNQQLTGQSAQSPVDVVARLGAMQAQDYAGVLWSVALRMAAGSADATEAGVEAALADGRIVRSWPMRRTYHLVVAEDLRWMLALLAPRVLDAAARSRAFLEIEDGELDRARAVVMATLADGEPRARRIAGRSGRGGHQDKLAAGHPHAGEHGAVGADLHGAACG